MSEVLTYLKLGYQHITDINGFDHMLFIAALCAVYSLYNWKHVLILVTAFTIGHSITLVLATLKLVNMDTVFVEIAIPVTIIVSCIFNFFHKFPKGMFAEKKQKSGVRYILALGFGLIHGLGFSSYLQSLLGSEAAIFRPLLSFNIGLEFGQFIVVGIFLGLNLLVTDIMGARKNNWNLIVSGIICGMSIMLLLDRLKVLWG